MSGGSAMRSVLSRDGGAQFSGREKPARILKHSGFIHRRDRGTGVRPCPMLFTASLRAARDNGGMIPRLDRAHRFFPILLGVVTLADVAVLLVWDMAPQRFPARSHEFLAAFSLTLIAVAYLVYQAAHRPPIAAFGKAVLLAVAFLFWAANQLWPALPQATLFNDLAVALFVLDIFLVIVGRPPAAADVAFAETAGDPDAEERS